MNKILLTVLLLGVTAQANAFYYVVGKHDEVVAKSEAPFTNTTSLESRGEKEVESSADINLNDAEYKNGAIVLREKTPSEKQIEKADREIKEEENVIKKRIRKQAMDSLRAEGVVFKRVGE